MFSGLGETELTMDTRKEALRELKVCRFCLTENEPLLSLYQKSKAPPSVVTLSTKILTCIGVEIFPSDKMPQYICNKCKFYMELFHGFKHVCRRSDKNILHFIQHGTALEPLNWASVLNKVYRLHTKSEFGVVKSVTQDGATVKVTAEELLDSDEEGDDDHVYNVKIEDGSDKMKNIKVITSVDNQERKGTQKGFANMTKLAKHLRTHASERPYPCKHCDKSFLKSHHYTRHLRLKHSDSVLAPSQPIVEPEPEVSYSCEKCGMEFRNQPDLIYHSAEHAAHSLTCPLCHEQFDHITEVTAHVRCHVRDTEQRCNFCELIFITQDKLQMHVDKVHANVLYDDMEMEQNEEEEEDEDEESMDTEGYEDDNVDNLDNVNENNVPIILNIEKAGEYMLAETEAMEEEEDDDDDDDENENDQLEDTSLEITLDASGSLLALKPANAEDSAPKPPKPVNELSSRSSVKNISIIYTGDAAAEILEEQKNEKEETNQIDQCAGVKRNTTSNVKIISVIDTEKISSEKLKEQKNEEEETTQIDKCAGVKRNTTSNVKTSSLIFTEDISFEKPEEQKNEREETTQIDKCAGVKRNTTSNVKTSSLIFTEDISFDKPVEQKNERGETTQIDKCAGVKRNTTSNVKTSSLIFTEDISFEKPEEQKNEKSLINRRVGVIRKVIQPQSSPVSNSTDKKKKTYSKVEITKPENNSVAGASDLSLRLLEKELQDLQRTNTRNEVSKTPAKPETFRNKRSQIHSYTPKPRAAEKKEVATPKSAPEKPVQEKRPPGRPPKDSKEVKNASAKEEKEAREKANSSIKEDKETKETKEKDTQVIKNGAEERTSTEEPVRRSTRPSKVKDYAKMISNNADEEEETSEEELEAEEPKEVEKSVQIPRRGRKPKSPAATQTPTSAPKKRGRPKRKEPSPIPSKLIKFDESENEDEATSSTAKPEDKETTLADEDNTSQESNSSVSASIDPATGVIVSPGGQQLKKVTMKALPPGIKPMPLPRKLPPSVCEMQIGKKMVKVQKIVMTKAEVEAMTKKGLVEMKDGTIVLKPGIKLPSSSAALKSPGSSKEKREIPSPRPTRCNLGDEDDE